MEVFSPERMDEYETPRDRLYGRLDLEDLLQADRPRLRHFESLGISRDWMEPFRKLHRPHDVVEVRIGDGPKDRR